MESTVDKKEKFLFNKETIQIINEFNIPWVIRGNILTLLGEEQFVEFVFNNETTEFVEFEIGYLYEQTREESSYTIRTA